MPVRTSQGRGARVASGLALGIVGLSAAAIGLAVYAPRLALGDGRPIDVLGSVVGVAGVALVVQAFRMALRGERRRWKLAVVPIVLLLLQFYVLPVVVAGLAGNADRVDVMSARSLGLAGARDVTFRTPDGTELAGWYVPGQSDADVVLAHGSHGTRNSVLPYLRLLVKLGYGVLAFDARGHGESAGDPNALGWRGVSDTEGAVRYLKNRPDTRRHRVALVGISMGGEEAIRAAAEGVRVAAIVSDGAGGSTTGDARAGGQAGLELVVGWLGMRATELLLGDGEPPSLVSLAERVTAPTLLIASGAEGELQINRAIAARAGHSARVWHIPDVAHTEALERHPRAYEERLRAFLEGAL